MACRERKHLIVSGYKKEIMMRQMRISHGDKRYGPVVCVCVMEDGMEAGGGEMIRNTNIMFNDRSRIVLICMSLSQKMPPRPKHVYN